MHPLGWCDPRTIPALHSRHAIAKHSTQCYCSNLYPPCAGAGAGAWTAGAGCGAMLPTPLSNYRWSWRLPRGKCLSQGKLMSTNRSVATFPTMPTAKPNAMPGQVRTRRTPETSIRLQGNEPASAISWDLCTNERGLGKMPEPLPWSCRR